MSDSLHPCPHCAAPAAVRITLNGRARYVECSNAVDCPQWPMTTTYPTEAEAKEAWQASNYDIAEANPQE